MSRSFQKRWPILITSVVAPSALLGISLLMDSNAYWQDERFDSVIDSFNAFTAIALGAFLWLQRAPATDSRDRFLSSALYSLGIARVVSSATEDAGVTAWTRALGLFAASVFLMGAWARLPWTRRGSQLAFLFLALLITAFLLRSALPEDLPSDLSRLASIVLIGAWLLQWRSSATELDEVEAIFLWLTGFKMVNAFFSPLCSAWTSSYWLLQAISLFPFIWAVFFLYRQLGRTIQLKILAQQQLEQSNRDLENFAHVASHDLQEPLRTVASFSRLLSTRYRAQLEGKGQEFLDIIQNSVARMQGMIADLLAYSRLGQPQLLERVECDTIVRQVLSTLRLKLEESQADVRVSPLPAVYGNRNQLARLFQNLLDNALKYRSSAPPEIDIQATREEDFWRFRVRDNGIGIDMDHAERIFVLFQRLHAAGEHSGTGIGLASAKRIVETLGGRIWVTSTPGKGSCFHFTLPALESPPAPSPIPAGPSTSPSQPRIVSGT